MSPQYPEANRVVKDGKNQSLKLSMLTKIHGGDEVLARVILDNFVINGAPYCYPHLQIYCHICEKNFESCHDDVNEERMRLGLRPGGDPVITHRAQEWSTYIQLKQLGMHEEIKLLALQYGGQIPPHIWSHQNREMNITERDINQEFMQRVTQTLQEGASECCYWACQKPKTKLFACAGCRIAKYCCKDHQQKDWKWEHRGECYSKLPQFLKEEVTDLRERNLQGDFRARDLDGKLENDGHEGKGLPPDPLGR
jgi:hypothetical protein